MRNISTVFLVLFITFSFAQDNKISKKTLQTNRVAIAPVIDGNLDDVAWQNADIATDFVMFKPGSGNPIPENIRTEVKIVYDNKAIYIAGYLYDDKPKEIPKEFTTRDNFGQTDFFLVSLSPMNDAVNAAEFVVMPTGNQADMSMSSSGEDKSWSAVWESKVVLNDKGWFVEMRIPYSALRFSSDKEQTWGLNIHRFFAKTKEQYTWNIVDKTKGEILQYDGILTGINNITPPVRLSFNPYASTTVSNFDGTTDFNWNIGMDLKYGINESFTLDATLIPDFGQTAFDDVTLNLGPFEQRFSEKRAFFTEGVDLFNKADFFYSRRVGSSPIGKYDVYNQLGANETIIENPGKVKLFNAIKLSGRTKKGLGIGIFNAVTQKTSATVQNTIDNSTRKIVTEPLANYNVVVLDKQFNKNSSVTLINTNVIRDGHFRDANVTGFLYDLKTKNSKYGVNGGVAMSNIYESGNTTTGTEGRLYTGKISGNHQFRTGFNFVGKDYDKNDLGFQRSNNKLNFSANYSYRIFKPKGHFNNYGFNTWFDADYKLTLDKTQASYLLKGNKYAGSSIGANFWATTKKQFSFGGNIHSGLGTQYDYDEARLEGRYFKTNPVVGANFWFSTDYRKKLAIDGGFYRSNKIDDFSNYTSFNIAPLVRLSNKTSIRYNFSKDNGKNLEGYVKDNGTDIIFGKRDVQTVTNTISAKYNFTVKSALSLSFRHFWSKVTYDDIYYDLQDNGTLIESMYTANHDINYNAWNLDLNYSWEFAPGSQLVLFYTNSIFNVDGQSELNFNDNLSNLFKQPIKNTLSLKVIYYLDYNNLRKNG